MLTRCRYLLLATLAVLAVTAGASLGEATPARAIDADSDGSEDNGDTPAVVAPPSRPFPSHTEYAADTIMPSGFTQAQMDEDVAAFYDKWRERYLVDAGESADGRAMVRVAFGKPGTPNHARTVSEGQGYGMMIVALMAGHDEDARARFDGLYEFVRAQPSECDSRLMDWAWPDAEGNASAFDGDCDIAYGLLLAATQWGGGGKIDYAEEARARIAAMLKSTIGPTSRLPMLGDWVEADGYHYNETTVRTSDFMLGHFRAFATATGDDTWSTVADNCERVLAALQEGYAETTGLVPDFAVNAATEPEPAAAGFLEGDHDGHYNYNAGRVPWRVGLDVLHHGTEASRAIVNRLTDWIATESGNDATAIKATYTLDGEPLGDYSTTFFIAPMGVAAMADPARQALLDSVYAYCRKRHRDYYEDSVNLLCLLAMSGNAFAPNVGTADTGDDDSAD